MSINRHSNTANAAYHDLISLLLDDRVSDIKGSPTLRTVNGKSYWYDRYRIGGDIHEDYLGEDSPELTKRLDAHASLGEFRKTRKQNRARLVRLLRGERFLGLDAQSGSLVSALARVGTFRLGGVLVGTTAFRLYEGELGLRFSMDELAMTNDIDIASFEKLSLALGDTVEPSLESVFSKLKFDPLPSLDQNKTWRWRQSTSQALVEFLTPSFTDDEGLRDLPALGVNAQSLHYLNFLMADPIHAAAIYREGILVRIPRPEKFAIHKLIISNRRRGGPQSLKASKDLMQAALLISALTEDRPSDLAEAYRDAHARGARWRAHLRSSLKRSPQSKALIDKALAET